MKSYLQDVLFDIVQHTYKLGNIPMLKISGTDDKTELVAKSEDKSVVVEATFKNPIPDFVGEFGMPNLAKLDTILNISEYAEDGKIDVVSKGAGDAKHLDGLHFENKAGDFKNDYRFMAGIVINNQLFKDGNPTKFQVGKVKWDAEFVPSVANILRFKYQMDANSEQATFTTVFDNNHLKCFFGEPSNHAGNFVFQSDVGAGPKAPVPERRWPVAPFFSILNLAGDKTIKLSITSGCILITVDSGQIDYNYIIMAQTK